MIEPGDGAGPGCFGLFIFDLMGAGIWALYFTGTVFNGTPIWKGILFTMATIPWVITGGFIVYAVVKGMVNWIATGVILVMLTVLGMIVWGFSLL